MVAGNLSQWEEIYITDYFSVFGFVLCSVCVCVCVCMRVCCFCGQYALLFPNCCLCRWWFPNAQVASIAEDFVQWLSSCSAGSVWEHLWDSGCEWQSWSPSQCHCKGEYCSVLIHSCQLDNYFSLLHVTNVWNSRFWQLRCLISLVCMKTEVILT